MGNNLFGQNIAGRIANAMGGFLLSGTLTKVGEGSYDTSSLLEGPTVTETTHTFKGIVEEYNDYQKSNTQIEAGDRKVLILGDTISGGVVPEVGDKITIEGRTYTIKDKGITRDPDEASYTCQVKGVN